MTIEELQAKLPSGSFRVDVDKDKNVVIYTTFTINLHIRCVRLTPGEMEEGFDYIMREFVGQIYYAGYNR